MSNFDNDQLIDLYRSANDCGIPMEDVTSMRYANTMGEVYENDAPTFRDVVSTLYDQWVDWYVFFDKYGNAYNQVTIGYKHE
jgi:hypothetical protein